MMLHYKASFKAKPDSSNLKAFAFWRTAAPKKHTTIQWRR
jgi:hypothetical protein